MTVLKRPQGQAISKPIGSQRKGEGTHLNFLLKRVSYFKVFFLHGGLAGYCNPCTESLNYGSQCSLTAWLWESWIDPFQIEEGSAGAGGSSLWILCQSQDLPLRSRRECLIRQQPAFCKAQRQRRGKTRQGAWSSALRRHLLTPQEASV